MPLTVRTVVKMREEGDTVTVWVTVNAWVGLPGESHGQKRLSGYSPWGLQRVEHDLTLVSMEQNLAFLFENCYNLLGQK